MMDGFIEFDYVNNAVYFVIRYMNADPSIFFSPFCQSSMANGFESWGNAKDWFSSRESMSSVFEIMQINFVSET